MDEHFWHAEVRERLEHRSALPKYQVLADAVAAAIYSGRLQRDELLPTVRELSRQLGLSGTTVAAAYRSLAQKGLTASRVGSGTRVAGAPRRGDDRGARAAAPLEPAASYLPRVSLWRRRTQTNHIGTLLRAFPDAQNYASGTPNPALLPLAVMKRAWGRAAAEVTAAELQYAGPAPVTALRDQLLTRLEADGVPTGAGDLLIGSSAQQLMTLAVQIAAALQQQTHMLVGVEEPGYPTLFDSYERLGHRLAGIAVDAHGALPSAVETVLDKGAKVVVFTPRAHNPTGVSWSPARRADLAEVLAAYPEVLVIEDDQFAEAANTRAGSLLQDRRLEDRVIYIRSFSKVIAPDLRLAAAVARSQLRALLMEGKFYTDGWSSTFSQKALAHAFADPELTEAVAHAKATYNRRRQAFVAALEAAPEPGTPSFTVSPGADGVNVWLELPSGVSAADVAERAAAAGVVVATGEPFFVRVGRDDALRVNTGMMVEAEIPAVSRTLSVALREAARATSSLFSQHSL